MGKWKEVYDWLTKTADWIFLLKEHENQREAPLDEGSKTTYSRKHKKGLTIVSADMQDHILQIE